MNRFIIFLGLFLFFSCEKSTVEFDPDAYYQLSEKEILDQTLNLPDEPFNYDIINKLPQFSIQFTQSIDADKATLGRVLFYDKHLSKDGKVSCASCHQQELAFADNESLSGGIFENHTDRNSIALGSFLNFNQEYSDENSVLFWDGRAFSIAAQMEETLANPNEMGMHGEDIMAVFESKEFYRILGKKAYPNKSITFDHVLNSIEVFLRSIQSTDSKFDAAIGSSSFENIEDELPGLNEEEALGKDLFVSHCWTCHGKSLIEFSQPGIVSIDDKFISNGLEIVYSDQGRFLATGLEEDKGKFKVPGLRNVAKTGPYMHDGRFDTLDEVVEFYNSGIQPHPNLDQVLKDRNDQPQQLNLSEQEKHALVAFLETLTDSHLLTDEKWSDPFVH